ncbi:conserved hypothetical protein [Lodderomyces elongisporus NRRL YB-4239]|uniref:Glycoside hydrolase family 3 N-terminal domain-containing protein n=1 Tax=Lodderomyces elongisporus (strain ATCC 11503 / CBS 2605 / JCM 1781 / NBRC 1676 / NRRL YB-4239) TaxID=379508 RepID=A5DRS0_LODEL|nr:conserved hypothetical protein [Lodderomyces elongisporus NRRL YB-4239]
MENQAGQLLCGGFQGTTVTAQAYHLIVEQHVSSMILSRKNAVNVEQMTKLINDLQYIAFTQGKYKYPIMFAIDEEGGIMNSLFDPEFLTQYPSAMALAATGDPQLVYEISKAIAIELKKIGFSIILGPVLDVVTKLSHQLVGVRSFGTTLDDVKTYGLACAKGLRDGGLFTVGKHFPGIGNATVDSLLDLPMTGDSLSQIRQFNAVPFRHLIEEGVLDGISAAGCGVPNVSPDETHACLSPIIVNQLLRKELNFKGFVISECLEMEALYHSIGLGQGVVLAINAGCDLVMVCHDFRLQKEAIESIKQGIINGNIDEETANASFQRIEKLQSRLPSWHDIFPHGAASAKQDPVLFKKEQPELWKKHQNLASLAYQKSITLVRDFNNILPITKHFHKQSEKEMEKQASEIQETESQTTAEQQEMKNNLEKESVLILSPLLTPLKKTKSHLFTGEEVFQSFGKQLSDHQDSFSVLHTTYTANGLTKLHEQLIARSKVVIVFTSEASRNMYQIGIVKYVSILCASKPFIVVATLSPFDFLHDKKIGNAYICCYDYTEDALSKVAGLLMGDFQAEGCIPGEMHRKTIKAEKRIKRRWLVEEFDIQRDFASLVKLWQNDTDECEGDKINYHDNQFYKRLHGLLATSEQKHFVVRNSSLNILYGVVLTWIEGDVGHLVYIIVEKSKRLQSIGKNLNQRALQHLKNCSKIYLGSSFPLLMLPGNKSATSDAFFNSVGWNSSSGEDKDAKSEKKYIMLLEDLTKWLVPSRILKELMIVGVRFDICNDAEQLMNNCPPELKRYYTHALESLQFRTPHEVKIIIALEPNTQSVIGSIVLFTNQSKLSKYYPFIDQCRGKSGSLVGEIIAPVIDPLYSNLLDIFKYGLICSAITFLKNSSDEVSHCLMADVKDDKSLSSIEDIGFKAWKSYYDYYGEKSKVE